MTHFLLGAAIASQRVMVIATWPDFVLLMLLLWLCLRSLHDKCLLSWPPLTKWAALSMTAGLLNRLHSRLLLIILPFHLLYGGQVQM